jgi:hypothetical protein
MTSSSKRESLMRALAIGHLVGAFGIVLFWIGFYTGVTFPPDVLARKIPNFASYYAFEKAFTLPDLTTAAVAAFAAEQLLRDTSNKNARVMIAGASGAMIFLTMLDVSYDFKNGMYDLGSVSLELLAVPLLGVLGAVTLALLARDGSTDASASRHSRHPA